MPAHQRVKDDQILAAIERWAFNVEAAAAAVRLHPKNLRERLARLGLGTEEIKRAREAMRTGTYQGLDTYRYGSGRLGAKSTPVRLIESGPKSSTGTFSKGDEGRRFPAVQTAAAASEPEMPLPKSPRLRPDHLLKLRELKWTLAARMKRDLTETDVLEMLLDETLPSFEKRAAAAAASAEDHPQEPVTKPVSVARRARRGGDKQ